MALFSQSLNSRLFLAASAGDDRGFAALLFPEAPAQPGAGYDLEQALTDRTLRGSFLLSAYTPDLSSEELTRAFTDKALALLGAGRYLIWITDMDDFSADRNTIIQGISADGSVTNSGIVFPLISNISLQVMNGMKLTADGANLLLGEDEGAARIQFTGPSAPDPNVSSATSGVIPFSGMYRGCIDFSLFISRAALSEAFNWGFQMLMPAKDKPVVNAISEYLPFADKNQPALTDLLGFNVKTDPSDVFNLAFDDTGRKDTSLVKQYASRRTFLDFTGKDRYEQPVVIRSCYFSTKGAALWLKPSVTTSLPARLIFNAGEQRTASRQEGHLAPEGDFLLIPGDGIADGDTIQLQCGLQGTEFFETLVNPDELRGGYLRFIGNQPAYAPVFPLPQSSPLTAPVKPDAPLLDTTYRTSWCTIVQAAAAPLYVAQPKGAALFGSQDKGAPGMMRHATPGFPYNTDGYTLFPMLPYTGVEATGEEGTFTKEQIEDFERLLISPLRKQEIDQVTAVAQRSAREQLKLKKLAARGSDSAAAGDGQKTVTTPTGLLADLQETGAAPVWQRIYLAQNGIKDQPPADFTRMYFSDPEDKLVQAFQTSDQFLVIANNDYLGIPSHAGEGNSLDGTARFYNRMFIGDWEMQADTGTQNRYNDYNNIIIIKGRKGALYDPADPDNSLVANWQKWTARDTFAAPTTLKADGTLNQADTAQLVILSQWLQTYFAQAAVQQDQQYFGNFNQIARNPNWTGILVLGMNITHLPDNLNGILSGVRFPAAFRAHHFGINITPVEQGAGQAPAIKSPSALFGLIYYNDPDFTDGEQPKPVQPDLSATYDFTLLNLKVLFENTSVKSFHSNAQLTTNNYFGSPVDHMGTGGNLFNTMILKGALQFKGNEAIYSLATGGVSTFNFNNPVVNKVEILNAGFSTLGTGDDGSLSSWFSLSGFWDFKKLVTAPATNEAGAGFDLFSFGYLEDISESRRGLLFNGLGIKMVSPPYKPGQAEPLTRTMTFETSGLTFDQGRSTPRPDSLYVNFALNLQNLVQGATDTTPQGKDYLTVVTDLKVSPIDGTPWLGLSYQLNMGTPGALAGNVGLTSSLLTAWDPTATVEDTAPPVLVGIRLPGTGGGAKLISLQSVLKLSIGQIRLSVAKTAGGKSSFLMMFTEIALKFLGLLKIPPNGSTLFYLFGNPQSDGKASGLGWYAMYKKDAAEKEPAR